MREPTIELTAPSLLHRAAEHLTDRWAVVFFPELVHRCVAQAHAGLASTARVHSHLGPIAVHAAGNRLAVLARAKGAVSAPVRQVLFVDADDTGPAAIAAGLLDHHAGTAVVTCSAGITPGTAVDPFAVEVLAQHGTEPAGLRDPEMAPALTTGVRLFVFATPAGVAVLAVATDTAAVMLLVAVLGAVVGYVLHQERRRAPAAARATDGTSGGLSDPPGTRPMLIARPEAPTMDDTALNRAQARLLHHALGRSGITVHRLWIHYLSLGGIVGELELEAYLHEIFHLPAVERDRLMHTANALLDPHGEPFLPCTGELLRRHRVHDQRGDHQN